MLVAAIHVGLDVTVDALDGRRESVAKTAGRTLDRGKGSWLASQVYAQSIECL